MRFKAIMLAGMAFTAIPAMASASEFIDRGLPDANLNNVSGSDRSNVAWGFNGDFFSGDDFMLPNLDPGKRKWRIDKLTLWTVGGESTLGDRYGSMSLFLGPEGGDIPKVSATGLTGNTASNPDVSVTEVTYPDTSVSYQASGGDFLNIWQIDFANLGTFDAGLHLFSLAGEGNDPITFNHASNAALSGTPQDGADGMYRWFAGTSSGSSLNFGGMIDSDGNGWDKSSDINVQVTATQIPVPASVILLLGGLLGLAGLSRARRA
jgi:hypothetical protein